MKYTLLALYLFLFSYHSLAAPQKKSPPDLPPDASSAMLENALRQIQQNLFIQSTPAIREIVMIGKRNLAWLEHINSKRPANDKLSFSSKGTQNGIPIDSPMSYSPESISQNLDTLKAELPENMRPILLEGQEFTDTAPEPLDQYLVWGRKTDKFYQTALRWMMMEPYLSQLAARRAQDIRGYYFFSRMPATDRTKKLQDSSQWTEQEKNNFPEWLISLCLNNGTGLSSCRNTVKNALDKKQDLNPLYNRWLERAKRLYEGFFAIPSYAVRNDVVAVNEQEMRFPFQTPESRVIQDFLQTNIEDEWRLGEWFLKMDFHAQAAAYVIFRPGVTPNVNGLGGNRITMNSEQPLTEYDAQWTIRHEFGHVLGFPDCYIEFYEEEKRAIVNYQIDVENLMCSRRGHLQDKHVQEMKRVYDKR